MLVAIFILLFIVFFPLLSLFLGIGITAVIVNYWWVIVLFIGFSALLSYGRKVNEREARKEKEVAQQKALIEAIKITKVEQRAKLAYTGEPILENDSYILYLVNKYAIEKNDVLGKYVLNETLYPSINEALRIGDALEQAEQEQKRESLEQSAIKAKADEQAYREMLTARKSNIKKLLVVLGVMLVAVVIGRVLYFRFEPTPQDSYQPLAPKGVLVLPIAPSFDCAKARSDSELAVEDNELFDLYKQAKAKSNDPVAFKAESVNSWKEREDYCHDKECLLNWYSHRKAYYQDILNK
jgi:hypothetical protein